MAGLSTSSSTFDFHGLFSVQVKHRNLEALMREELGVFARELNAVDLTVIEGAVAPLDRMLSIHYSFDGVALVVQTPSGRVRLDDRVLVAEPTFPAHLLLAHWVENLMRQRIVPRGAALVHASAVERNGEGYLLPAWAHTGKTNVALSFLSEGWSYMADDWCFVSETGRILGYPRWLNLFDYNFDSHGSLMSALDRGNLAALRRRIAVTKFAKSLTQSTGIARTLRRWLMDRYFVHARVPASVVVPGCRTTLRAPITKVCLLSTSRSAPIGVSELAADEMARRIVLCGQFERSTFGMHQLAFAYCGARNPQIDLAPRERDVLFQAFRDAKCLEVTLPPAPSAAELERVRLAIESG